MKFIINQKLILHPVQIMMKCILRDLILTILESYAAGTKSIVSKNTATEEALTFADGYAIKFGDLKALNNLIDKMLLNKYLPKKINSNIRTHNEFLVDLYKIYSDL